MPIVLNVFCCGTGEHHENTGNIVVEAHNAAERAGNVCHIIDGVGQKTHRVYKNKKEYKRWNTGPTDYTMLRKHKNHASGLTGYGVYDNIRNALVWIHEMMDDHTATVNLVGWSRGGVECIMLTHSIHRAWPNMDINVFAIDPVAGGMLGCFNPYVAPQGKFNETGITGDYNKLSPGVNEYYGIVADQIAKFSRNPLKSGIGTIKKLTFGSVRPKLKGAINGHADRNDVHMPSDHSGVAKISGPVGEIVASECGWFLQRNGTPNHGLRKMGEGRTMEKYAQVRQNFNPQIAKQYVTRHGHAHDKMDTKSRRGIARNRRNGQNEYLSHPFFVNAHHASVARAVLSKPVFDELDALEKGDTLTKPARAAIRGTYPQTEAALKQFGLWR